MNRVEAFISLGANLGEPVATLRSAVAALRRLQDARLTGLSSLYRSAPVGPAGQDDYLNAVARLETSLPPHGLLQALQAIEQAHGRIRLERWGPRTLDLDLLLFGNDQIITPELVVPHPEMERRNFVLLPLLELAPDLHLPGAGAIAVLPAATDYNGIAVHAPGPAWGD